MDALVSVAEAAAASLLAASVCWLWEVEEDGLMHLEGIMAVQAGRGASLEVVQGQHVVERCLLVIEQVQAAGVGYPVLAFVAPHLGEAGVEEGAPWVRGIAAVLDRQDEGRLRLAPETPRWEYGVQLCLA